jgi:hypothetical protein
MRTTLGLIVGLLGIIFLVVPLGADSYSHFLQNSAYTRAHDQVIACRANQALDFIHNESILVRSSLERTLDMSCGTLPKYDDFSYEGNGILSLYSWVGQKVTFIPL